MLTFGSGGGLVNTIINKLPIELHLPSYKFCGPGTRLKERLAHGQRGINLLDEACREHDIAYAQHADLKERHEADKILVEKAWDRAKHSPSVGERIAALSVAGIMKAKTKLGLGLGKRRWQQGMGMKKTFREAVRKAKMAIKPTKNAKIAIKLALAAAKSVVPKNSNKRAELA